MIGHELMIIYPFFLMGIFNRIGETMSSYYYNEDLEWEERFKNLDYSIPMNVVAILQKHSDYMVVDVQDNHVDITTCFGSHWTLDIKEN